MKFVLDRQLRLLVAIIAWPARSTRRHRNRCARAAAVLIVVLRLPLRHRLLAAHRRDRLVVEPDLRHDRRHAAAHLPGLPRPRLDRPDVLRHGAVGRRDRLHRLLERRHDVAGSEDRLPRRRDAAAISRSRSSSARSPRRWCSGPSCCSSTRPPPSTCRDHIRTCRLRRPGTSAGSTGLEQSCRTRRSTSEPSSRPAQEPYKLLTVGPGRTPAGQRHERRQLPGRRERQPALEDDRELSRRLCASIRRP